jgi:hypothetical protein
MLSSANITLLGFLSSIEENTIGFLKNMQDSVQQRQNHPAQKNFANANNTGANSSPTTRVPLYRMRADPFTEVCAYLEPKDLCSLKAVSTFSQEVISKHSKMYWKNYCHRIYGTIDLRGEADYNLKYLSLRIKDLEMKHANMTALQRQRSAIDHFRQQGGRGVIGIVSEMAWVEDEAIAKTISRKRFMAMATVLTTSEGVIPRFKDATKHFAARSATSFMPHATAAKSVSHDTSHIDLLKRKVDAPGFLGYAVNLLKLRSEHEYLRYSVFWIIFSNLMIFDTVQNLFAFYSTLEVEDAEKMWAVSVDQYAHEIEDVFPRLLTRRNECADSEAPASPTAVAMLTRLEDEIRRTKHSYTVLRYA